MAKNQNTYAKRQREMEKKAKAEAKRIRRTQRKQGLDPSEITGYESRFKKFETPDADAEESNADGETPKADSATPDESTP